MTLFPLCSQLQSGKPAALRKALWRPQWEHGAMERAQLEMGGYQMRYCGADGNWTSKISSVCFGEYRRWSLNTTVSEGIDPYRDFARDERSWSSDGYHTDWGFVGNNWEVVLNPPENDGEGRVILGASRINLDPQWLHIKLSENYPVYLRNVGLEMTDWYERKYNCVGGNFDTEGLGILIARHHLDVITVS